MHHPNGRRKRRLSYPTLCTASYISWLLTQKSQSSKESEKRTLLTGILTKIGTWNIHRGDLSLLPMTIKFILCKHDCSRVPISQKQLGVWRGIEALGNFWGVERDASSPPQQQQPLSPEAGNITQEEDVDVGEELNVPTTIVNPEGGRFTVLEAPPPVKKIKREKHFQKSLNLQI